MENLLLTQRTYAEFIDIATQESCAIIGEQSSRATDSYRSSWSGTPDFKTAQNLLKYGWKEGREFVGRIAKEIKATLTETPTKPNVYDVVGNRLDVGRYLANEPECMVRPRKKRTTTPVIRLLFNITTSSGVTPEAMKWKGAIVVALIQLLQTRKKQVAVDALCATDWPINWAAIVHIKTPSQPINLDSLAYMLGHPSAFRRIWFSYMEREPLASPAQLGCAYYGVPIENAILLPELTKQQQQLTYDLVIPEFHLYRVADAAKVVAELFNQLLPEQPLTY